MKRLQQYEYGQQTEDELRIVLRQRNLDHTGHRHELVERLRKDDRSDRLVQQTDNNYNRAFRYIEALIGGTILFHLRWRSDPDNRPTLIGPDRDGILFNEKILTRNGSRVLGMGFPFGEI